MIDATRAGWTPRPVPVTVWRRVDGDAARAFDAIVPVDLTAAFTGYGPLPAVVRVDATPDAWGSAAGQARSVRLAGGGVLRETVLEVRRPGLFRYEVVPEAGPLQYVVRSIDGRFVFSPSEAGGTVIRWTYVFRPRRGAQAAVHALAPLWRRYAEQVMGRLAQAVDANAPAAEPGVAAD